MIKDSWWSLDLCHLQLISELDVPWPTEESQAGCFEPTDDVCCHSIQSKLQQSVTFFAVFPIFIVFPTHLACFPWHLCWVGIESQQRRCGATSCAISPCIHSKPPWIAVLCWSWRRRGMMGRLGHVFVHSWRVFGILLNDQLSKLVS